MFRKSPVASRCRLRLFVARTRRRFEHELCGSCLSENDATVEQNDTPFRFSNLQLGIKWCWQQESNSDSSGINEL